MKNNTENFNLRYIIAILDNVEPYYIISIIIIGFIGNTLSFSVFISPKLRIQGTSTYLAVLALVDNGFLVSLLIVTLRHFDINLFDQNNFVCKTTVYFTYIFGFLSVWCMVTLSIERFFLLFFPFKRCLIMSHSRKYVTLSILILFSICIYFYALITSEIKNDQHCLPNDKWIYIVQAMGFVDTIITFIVPFMIVLIVNTAIIFKMRKFKKDLILQVFYSANKFSSTMRKAYLVEYSLTRNTSNRQKSIELVTLNDTCNSEININRIKSIPTSSRPSLSTSIRENTRLSKQKLIYCFSSNIELMRRRKIYWKMTRILLIISVSFLVLNFPICFAKIVYFIRGFDYVTLDDSSTFNSVNSNEQVTIAMPLHHLDASDLDELIERISHYLYYLNFSINFFLYTLFGSKLRLKKNLSKYIECKCTNNKSNYCDPNFS